MFKTKHNLIIPILISCLALPTTHADEPTTEPIFRIETGMHTAAIWQIGVDAAERFLLTASEDKTLRLWDLHTGDLLNTYRVPIGAGDEGKLYSGAISPDGEWVAGAGETEASTSSHNVYLFNRVSGKLVKRLSGLENAIHHLCVSKDGQYLGASLGSGGVRVWDIQTWRQIFSNTDYADSSYWCDFDKKNRLVTSSYDGYLRLYSSASNGFSLVAKSEAPGGSQPYAAVFSPAGNKIAVGFNDSTNVNVLDGHDLAFLYAPDTTGIDNDLRAVAWSQDGNSLYAGGGYSNKSGIPVLHWPQAGQGNYTEWRASLHSITDIRPLKNGSIVYGASAPAFAVLNNAGNKIVEQEESIADYRAVYRFDCFYISHDGNTIHFCFDVFGERPASFSLSEESLIHYPRQDANLTSPDTTSLNITGWEGTYEQKLNGKSLSLRQQCELSRSLAIAPDKSKFLLGTRCNLYLFDTNGQQIWTIDVPDVAWGVNISGDGKNAVVAFADGTIRWYNIENGEELLTFFPHKDGKRWIAWTPSGYYMSSGDNADNLMGWHVNKGKDKAARFYPAAALHATHKRPDIVKKMLETLDEDEAIRLANLEKEGDVEVPVSVGKELAKVKKKYEVNLEPSGLGKVIIIAAGGEHEDNTLFPYSNDLTTEMYRIVFKRGFTDGDIVYMNPYPPIVPVNAYVDAARQDFSLRDPKAELQQAFLQVGKELNTGQQFILYLHGHANPDALIMNQATNLSAQQLKILLDQIPTDVEQLIILDTCYSGSFLPELAGVENRIVITSADAKTQDWNAKLGSFSAYFFEAVDSGFNVKAAFKNAEDEISANPKFFGKQRPQLDDTQDGLYDSSRDGEFARQTYFGIQKVHGSLPPEITEIHPTIKLAKGQSTATLWLKAVPDFNGMKKVRAILINEHDSVTQYQGESTDFTRRELTLKPNHNLQRYEIDYNQFDTANSWTIFYKAQSMEGDWSKINVGYAVSESINLAIKSQLNKTTYTVGDNLQFDVAMSGVETVDLYVGIIFPEGYYLTIAEPLNFSESNVLQPYKTAVKLTGEQTFNILSLDLPALTPGDYQACGLLTSVQSDPHDNANLLHFECKEFDFQ